MRSTSRRTLRLAPPSWALSLASVVTLLVVWELAARAGVLEPRSYPPPTQLVDTVVSVAVDGFPRGVTIAGHGAATAWRIIRGFVLATVLAVPLGLVIGRSRVLDLATAPIITFARSIATISLLPLAVAWFSVGETSRIFLITFGAFWIILTNTVAAVKGVDPTLVRAAHTLGSTGSALFTRVILPASLPRIFAGMKVALGMSFLVIVAVEMIGTVEGLGALIMEARTFYRSDVAMVGMALLALFGFLLSAGLDRLERRLLPWAAPDEGVR